MTECPTRESATGQPFVLNTLPALSRSTLDRHAELRTDRQALAELWRGGRLLPVDSRGRVPGSDVALDFQSCAAVPDELAAGSVFLGSNNGTGYWAARVDHDPGAGWPGLRELGAVLNATDAGVLTSAVSLLNWHQQARFCTVCGGATDADHGGWVRICTGCGREEYPRTDPAVICLVHDEFGTNGQHVLLATQTVWPSERYSVLAGFVEAGESLEACVVREVEEEVGVVVRQVRYLGSQPWPLPRSLMIGFAAVADRDAEIRLTDGEIQEAHWVHRDELRAAILAGGAVPGLRLPPEVSIARQMLDSWAMVD